MKIQGPKRRDTQEEPNEQNTAPGGSAVAEAPNTSEAAEALKVPTTTFTEGKPPVAGQKRTPVRKVYDRFEGAFHNNNISRNKFSRDFGTGRQIREDYTLSGIEGLVVTALIGMGQSDNATKDPFFTLIGQWRPGRQFRVSFYGHFMKPAAKALLMPDENGQPTNVDMNDPNTIISNDKMYVPLVQQFRIAVNGQLMTDRNSNSTNGIAGEELYVINDDGSFEVIIGTSQPQEARGGGGLLDSDLTKLLKEDDLSS